MTNPIRASYSFIDDDGDDYKAYELDGIVYFSSTENCSEIMIDAKDVESIVALLRLAVQA